MTDLNQPITPEPHSVSAVARAIAAGIGTHDDRRALRVTVTLLPQATAGRFSLARWPEVADALLLPPAPERTQNRVALSVRAPGGGTSRTVHGELSWDPPNASVREWIGNLWSRLVAPPSAIWPGQSRPLNDLWTVLRAGCSPPPPQPAAIRMPAATASVAFPLERARLLLGHLAPPGAPVHARPGLRTEIAPAARLRPAAMDSQLRLASLPRHGDIAPELPAVPHAVGPAALSGVAARMPAPDQVAAAMLAGGPAATAIFDGMYAMHESAFKVSAPPPKHENPPSCGPDSVLQDIARRRLGALLTCPSLQRLLGLALDVLVPQQNLESAGWTEDGDTVWEIGLADPPSDIHAGWTLARRRMEAGAPAWFMPCTRAEVKGGSDAVRDALVHLGQHLDGTPRYDLCTFDATLAVEASANRDASRTATQEQGEAPDPRRADLQYGGLRLVDRFPELRLLHQHTVQRRRHGNADRCGAGIPAEAEDADDLAAGERLYLGLRTASGHAWRSPYYRIVEYKDPMPPDGVPAGWLEDELRRRLGAPDGARRLELDSGSVAFAPMLNEKGIPICDGNRACWTGEAMGFDTPSFDARPEPGSIERVTRRTVRQELDLTRHYRLPSAGTGIDHQFLNPVLRYGWPYHVLLAQVFPAGISLSPAEAGVAVAQEGNGDLTLPALPAAAHAGPSPGRRFLRHQPVGAPVLALPPNESLLQPSLPRAALSEAVLRTATGISTSRATPGPIRRVLLAPRVALHEAALHDVFRGLAATVHKPRAGLNDALKEEMIGQESRPPVIRFDGKPADKPCYPDPAASYMVLALRLPRAVGDSGWVDEHTRILPLNAPLDPRAAWPDSLPVHVVVRRAAGKADLIQVSPGYIGSGKAALPCHTVTISLRPGEAYTLTAWCVPSVAQLRDWFDLVESAALLAAIEGGSTASSGVAQSCTRGLASLLGDQAVLAAPSSPSGPCTGAGGLPVPSPGELDPIATAVHHQLRRRPIPGLAHVSTIDLLHAAEAGVLAPPILEPGSLRVVRRDATDTEALLRFLAQETDDGWDAQADEAGAKTVLFAGKVRIDTASFEALELHVRCAAPGTAPLDSKRGRSIRQIAERDTTPLEDNDGVKLFGFQVSKDHRVSWPDEYKHPKRAMRIDGLPLPPDGVPRPMTFSLADLHARAIRELAARKETLSFGPEIVNTQPGGLRVTLDAFLDVPEARYLEVIPVAISRHSNALRLATETAIPEREDALVKRPGAGVHLWLRATARPPAPILRDVTYAPWSGPATRSGGKIAWTVSQERLTRLVVRLEPAWYQSGEGERLAVVLWPPGVFNRGFQADDRGRPLPPFELRDEDLGPAGAFVTRWGGTSSVNDHAVPNALVDPAVFGPVPPDDPLAQVPVAWLPLSDETGAGAAKDGAPDKPRNPNSAGAVKVDTPDQAVQQGGGGPTRRDAGVEASPAAPPRRFAAVALRTFVPRFDPIQQIWYVEIDMLTDPAPSPTVRLGLVRFQPHAREDLRVQEGVEPEYLRVSEAVTIPVEVMPGRRMDATCRTLGPNLTEVNITVQGPSGRPASYDHPIGPGMCIRIQRERQLAGGQWTREGALDADGQTCLWRSWDHPNHAIPLSKGWAWSCRFILPEQLGASTWRYAAVVEETLRLPPASRQADATELEGRPTLLEPLHLEPP